MLDLLFGCRMGGCSMLFSHFSLRYKFLDALASLEFKLSVSQSVSDLPFSASASTGLSELFRKNLSVK